MSVVETSVRWLMSTGVGHAWITLHSQHGAHQVCQESDIKINNENMSENNFQIFCTEHY